MGLASNLKINLFSKLTRQVFVKQYLSTSCNFSVNQIVPATDEFVWNTSNPVKIRMENTAPGNYPPMLVQTMMRNTVDKHGSRKAIGKVPCLKKIEPIHTIYWLFLGCFSHFIRAILA